MSTDGTSLKSARFVSTTVFGPRDRPISNTMAVMQFGQFINHDFQFTGTYDLGNLRFTLHFTIHHETFYCSVIF